MEYKAKAVVVYDLAAHDRRGATRGKLERDEIRNKRHEQ
jgi:hypothetical protein